MTKQEVKDIAINVLLGLIVGIIFLFLVFGCSSDFRAHKVLKIGNDQEYSSILL